MRLVPSRADGIARTGSNLRRGEVAKAASQLGMVQADRVSDKFAGSALDCQDNGASVHNACDAGERRQIQAELDVAQAELAAAVDLQGNIFDWEPPH